MKRLSIISILLAAFLLSPHSLGGASPPLTVTTRPTGFVAGDDVTVTVIAKVTRHSGDRRIVLALDCDHFYGESGMDIHEDTPSQIMAIYRDVPAGNCQAVAVLLREEGQKVKQYAAFSAILRILSAGAEPSLI